MKKAEDRIQQEIVMHARNTYCTTLSNPRCAIFSVPNERKDTRELMQLMQTGLMAGVSDLIFIIPNKVIFIEVKTETGSQQNNQVEFQRTVTDLGHDYWLVRSLSDFMELVEKEGIKSERI